MPRNKARARAIIPRELKTRPKQCPGPKQNNQRTTPGERRELSWQQTAAAATTMK